MSANQCSLASTLAETYAPSLKLNNSSTTCWGWPESPQCWQSVVARQTSKKRSSPRPSCQSGLFAASSLFADKGTLLSTQRSSRRRFRSSDDIQQFTETACCNAQQNGDVSEAPVTVAGEQDARWSGNERGPTPLEKPRVLVVGVGGGGVNAVTYMMQAACLEGVEFLAIDTDSNALDALPAQSKLLIGGETSEARGAGGRTDIGAAAARASDPAIQKALQGAALVFVVAGLGRGTGTGAAPVVAQLAKEAGALSIGFVTTPFSWEGAMQSRMAEHGVSWMLESSSTLVVFENSRIPDPISQQASPAEMFRIPNEGLLQGVKGITDIIAVAGVSSNHLAEMRLDLADIRTVMENGGRAMLGYGVGRGPNRAEDAAREAVSAHLQTGAVRPLGVLYNITCGPDITLSELEVAASVVQDVADPNALLFFGQVIDPTCEGEVRITMVATGFSCPIQKLGGFSQDEQAHLLDKGENSSQRQGTTYSAGAEARVPFRRASASDSQSAVYEVPQFLDKLNNKEKKGGFWSSVARWLSGT